MSPPIVDRRRPGLVWPVRVDPLGIDGPTVAQARGSRWTAGTRGYYLPSDLDPGLATDQRIVTAAVLLPPGGAVTGWASLRWRGVRYQDGTRHGAEQPITLAMPVPTIRPRAGIEVTSDRDQVAHAGEIDGLAVTEPLIASAFEARLAPSLQNAVRVIDMVAASDQVSLDELRDYAVRRRAARGIARLQLALGLADENVWSPMETTMRLTWRSFGLRNVVCNRPVFSVSGEFLGAPDLLDLDAGVVGEYDGGLHLAGGQRAKDISREGAFRRAGLEYVEMVAADVRDPRDFHLRTRDALDRARSLSRRWTIELPPDWVQTHTVALRRALSDWERRRYLRWQAS